jgi:hypothetical protein
MKVVDEVYPCLSFYMIIFIFHSVVGVQIMVALVVSWYASNQIKTIQRANRAELMAQIESREVEQGRKIEAEKIALQQNIEQIVATHAQAVNTHKGAKIPLEPYPTLLWPLINTFNMQQARLQRAREMEAEMYKLQQAIVKSSEEATAGNLHFDRPTGTFLDSFLSALKMSGPRSRYF